MNICYNCIINIRCICGAIKLDFVMHFCDFFQWKKNSVQDLHPPFPHFGKIQYLGHSKWYIFFTFRSFSFGKKSKRLFFYCFMLCYAVPEYRDSIKFCETKFRQFRILWNFAVAHFAKFQICFVKYRGNPTCLQIIAYQVYAET